MKTQLYVPLLAILVWTSIANGQVDAEARNNQKIAGQEAAQSGLVGPGSVSWSRSAFEAGVAYNSSDQIGSTAAVCPAYGWAADWFAVSVSWTTGGPSTPTKTGAVPRTVPYKGQNRTIVFNGTFPVFANGQKFDPSLVGQTTTATLNLRIHCLDGTYPYIDMPASQPITIYDSGSSQRSSNRLR
jgi:hypothetical protein